MHIINIIRDTFTCQLGRRAHGRALTRGERGELGELRLQRRRVRGAVLRGLARGPLRLRQALLCTARARVGRVDAAPLPRSRTQRRELRGALCRRSGLARGHGRNTLLFRTAALLPRFASPSDINPCSAKIAAASDAS